ATVLSSKRKVVFASASSRTSQLFAKATRLCACNCASNRPMVDSATVESYTPAALDQRTPYIFEVSAMRSKMPSTPAKGTWINLTDSGRSSGKSGCLPLKKTKSGFSDSSTWMWPAASRASADSFQVLGIMAYFMVNNLLSDQLE